MSMSLALQPAVNRLLPYRGLHTDLVAAEEYYSFNEPTVPELTAWTQGSNADLVFSDTSSSHYFDGSPAFEFHPVSAATNNVNVYVQAAVSNIDSALPCTVRVIARSDDAARWLRIYDPGDANTDVWVDLFGEALGTVGSDVIEARLTNPPKGTTAGGNGDDQGEANGFVQVDFELPAAASRTIRIQLVDGNNEVNFTGSESDNLLWIASASVLNGKVSSWRCRQTGRRFSQATASLQPYARPLGVPQFNGRRVLKFTNAQYLVSDDIATEWAFLNSGAECSVYVATLLTLDNSGFVLSTVGFSPTTDGWRFSYEQATDEWTIGAYNASAAAIFQTLVPAALNTLYVLGYRGDDGHADGDVVFDLGGTEYTENASNWGAGAPPTNTLHIGGRPPAGNTPFDGYIADIAIYGVRLDDDEHARALEEFECWNASSASIPGCVFAVQADAGIVGDPIDEWTSRVSGLAFTGVADPDVPAAATSFRGSLSIRIEDGQAFINTDDLIPDLNADHAVISCLQVLNDSADSDVIWEFRNSGTNTYENLAYSAGQWVYTRRAQGGSTDAVSVGTANFLPHVHSFVHASGQRSAWVDGVNLFENVASNPGTMTTTDYTLLGSGDAIGSDSDLSVAEFAVYNVAPNAYQRQLVERAQRRRMLGLDALGDSEMKLGVGIGLGYSLGGVSEAPPPPATDMVIITRFSGITGNFPATVMGTATVECWSGGGGGTTNGSAGGGGSYARINAYVYTANESYTFAGFTAGAVGGGTSAATTFNTTVCVAAGAIGNAGGLAASCTGDVTRSGVNGASVAAANNTGGGSPGSSTAAGAVPVPGGPDGGGGGISVSGAVSARIPGGGGASSSSNQRAGAAGLARLTYLMESLGTHPDLIGAAITRSEVDSAAHPLTIPSGEDGDTLVYCVGSDGAPTFTLTGATLVAGSASTTVVAGAMYSFPANGSEPTTLGLSASEAVDVIVLRFRNLATISGTATNSTIANADPPSHDMGSSAATTWLTMLVVDSTNTTGGTITARPANYDESLYVPTFSHANGIALCLAWRDATAQLENPGVWANAVIANVTITAGARR